MADVNNEKPNEQTPPSEADSLFNKMQSAVPSRDVVLPDEKEPDVDNDASIEGRMDGGRKPSDVQLVLRQLFPNLEIHWLNTLQMARVPPECYIPLKRIIVKTLVRDYGKSVSEAVAIAEVAVDIPLDGESRIEAIAAMGRGAEIEENKQKNSLGI